MFSYDRAQDWYACEHAHLSSSQEHSYAEPARSQPEAEYPDTHANGSNALLPSHQIPYLEQADEPLCITHPPPLNNSLYGFNTGAGFYTLPTDYDRYESHHRDYVKITATQRPSFQYLGSSSRASELTDRSPSVGGCGGSVSLSRPSPSPRVETPEPQNLRRNMERASAASSDPTLIRTSVLTQQSSSTFLNPGFNPYSIYPSIKATLKVNGDTLSMAVVASWSEDEKKVERRLVEFHRRQKASIIHATFKPVSLKERTQRTHCVSCIFWKERNECFITSVDTITLLEGLIGVQFTVEEKNRIRRNLEGYKPLTVSTQKNDSERFFRLIMGFRNPKPRTIEKEIKVFPWSILENALKKVIGKYVSDAVERFGLMSVLTFLTVCKLCKHQRNPHIVNEFIDVVSKSLDARQSIASFGQNISTWTGSRGNHEEWEQWMSVTDCCESQDLGLSLLSDDRQVFSWTEADLEDEMCTSWFKLTL